MKMIGRIFIILAVFLAVSGLMVVAVNASGTNTPNFGGDAKFRPGDDGVRSQGDDVRPEGDQNRTERHGDGPGGHGSRWMFGLVKNVGVMAVIVALIAWPRSAAKKRKKQIGITSASDDV